MNKVLRKASIVIGIIILIGGIYLSNQIGKGATKEQKKPVAQKEKTAPKNYAYTLNVLNKSVGSEVIISGKVIARQKVDLYSEVTGQLIKAGKEFREGIYFKEGNLLLTIDDTEAKYDLRAAKSQLYSSIVMMLPDLENDYNDNFTAWKNYIDNFDIDAPIQALPKAKSSREKLYVAVKQIENQYINIKKQEYRLTKYKIAAPFSGVLSDAMTYEGALVRSGQKLGTLTHASRYEVEATVSLYDVQFFRVGNRVSLYSEATDDTWQGTIARFGKSIDEQTQTQKVFITVNSAKLNEGMLLNGKINTKTIDNVVKIPRNLLIDNKAIYVIENNKLQLQEVNVIKTAVNDMYIRGISDGTPILAQPILGAFEGMKVDIVEN
jgi:hypothetical protein